MVANSFTQRVIHSQKKITINSSSLQHIAKHITAPPFNINEKLQFQNNNNEPKRENRFLSANSAAWGGVDNDRAIYEHIVLCHLKEAKSWVIYPKKSY